jgi:hypothetical protein
MVGRIATRCGFRLARPGLVYAGSRCATLPICSWFVRRPRQRRWWRYGRATRGRTWPSDRSAATSSRKAAAGVALGGAVGRRRSHGSAGTAARGPSDPLSNLPRLDDVPHRSRVVQVFCSSRSSLHRVGPPAFGIHFRSCASRQSSATLQRGARRKPDGDTRQSSRAPAP